MTITKDLEDANACNAEIQVSLKKYSCALVPTSTITTRLDGTLVSTSSVRIEKMYEPEETKYPN